MSELKNHIAINHEAPKEPNYTARRIGAAAIAILVGLGVWKAGELVADGVNALQSETLGCAQETVQSGDMNRDPINRAIEALAAEHEGFSPAHGTETNRVAESLGIIHPGDTVKVCAVGDVFPLGDTITADVSKN